MDWFIRPSRYAFGCFLCVAPLSAFAQLPSPAAPVPGSPAPPPPAEAPPPAATPPAPVQSPAATPAPGPVRPPAPERAAKHVSIADHSLSVEAKSVASGGKAETNGTDSSEMASLTYRNTTIPAAALVHTTIRNQENTEALEVRIHNFSPHPDAAHCEWYFIAKSPEKQMFVWDQGGHDFQLMSNAESVMTLRSAPLTQTLTRKTKIGVGTDPHTGVTVVSNRTGSESRTGSHPYGWILRLVAGEQVLKVLASSEELREDGLDQEKLDALVKAGAQ